MCITNLVTSFVLVGLVLGFLILGGQAFEWIENRVLKPKG